MTGGSAESSRANRVLVFVFITVFLDLIGFGIILPLLPFYVQSMGGNAQTVGILLACFSFTQLLATPVLGRLSDRFGRRPVILLSLGGNALSMVVFAAATRVNLLPLLFASRIVAGATAGNLAACQAAIADVTEGPDRAKGMGRLGAGIGLGMVLGPVAGGQLAEIGPSAPALGAAALALLDLAGAFFLMPETNATKGRAKDDAPPSAGHPEKTLGQVLTNRHVVLVLLLYFLTFLCMTSLQVALALLANLRLGWGATEVGHTFGLYGVILLVVQGMLIGRIARAMGEINVVLLGSAAVGGGMLVVAVAHTAVTMLAGLSLVGIGIGVTLPVLSSIASTYAGKRTQGAVLGFAQSSGGLARTVGPIWAGFLYSRVAPGAPFAAASITALLSIFVALRLKTMK